MSKNIKLGENTLSGVQILKLKDADDTSVYDIFGETSQADITAGHIRSGHKGVGNNGEIVTGTIADYAGGKTDESSIITNGMYIFKETLSAINTKEFECPFLFKNVGINFTSIKVSTTPYNPTLIFKNNSTEFVAYSNGIWDTQIMASVRLLVISTLSQTVEKQLYDFLVDNHYGGNVITDYPIIEIANGGSVINTNNMYMTSKYRVRHTIPSWQGVIERQST